LIRLTHSLFISGCSEDYGQRSGENTALCEEIYPNACQYSGCEFEDSDIEIQQHDGPGNERGY